MALKVILKEVICKHPHLPIGHVLGGHYEIIEIIGQGVLGCI